jgi:hypothetical protein
MNWPSLSAPLVHSLSTVKATPHSLELTHFGVDNNGTHERVIDYVVVTKD